jgi:4'-phosphopantetheinyl transferase EntD
VPLFYQHNINDTTRLAIWKIEETESFFANVPLSREITHSHKRLQHLAGRYLLSYLFPDFPYNEIVIADTRKPYLPDEQYHFSISHCGDYAAAIVSNQQRVGIDIEIPTAKVLKILHKFLHPEELKLFKLKTQGFLTPVPAIPFPASDPYLSTLLWSVKETMFKWWGLGEVDFSEMLRVNHFELKEEGEISAAFIRRELNIPLTLLYKQFPQICLAYLFTE